MTHRAPRRRPFRAHRKAVDNTDPDTWQRRHAHRSEAVTAVHRSEPYAKLRAVLFAGEIVEHQMPAQPDPEDQSFSKRTWEKSVQVWRLRIRTLVESFEFWYDVHGFEHFDVYEGAFNTSKLSTDTDQCSTRLEMPIPLRDAAQAWPFSADAVYEGAFNTSKLSTDTDQCYMNDTEKQCVINAHDEYMRVNDTTAGMVFVDQLYQSADGNNRI
jgi:hypothetical protein